MLLKIKEILRESTLQLENWSPERGKEEAKENAGWRVLDDSSKNGLSLPGFDAIMIVEKTAMVCDRDLLRRGNGKEYEPMKIKDLLKPEAVITGANVESKDQAISMLIDLHDKVGNLSDKAAYAQAVLQREAECVTAIGQGLAIPHAKSDAVRTPGLAAITVPQGIDCKSLDGQPSNLFFMIAAPVNGDLHLEILSGLVSLLMDPNLCARLLQCTGPETFLDELNRAEAEKSR